MRSSGMVRSNRSRSGDVSSSERGGGSSQPPDATDSIQCRPARSIVAGSARTTCSTRNCDQTSSSTFTADLKFSARAASAAAFSAPAEVPTRTSNGHGASGGNHSAIAPSTPTWYAARAPPPARTKASRFSKKR